MLVPSGVTPPPIISAIEPVTTTEGRSGSKRFPRALHCALGAVAAEFLLAETRWTTMGSFVRRQRVRIVEHGGHGQVLAADRAVDDDLQALDRGKGVDRAPVTARAVMIDDERHTPTLSSALAAATRRAANLALNSGRGVGVFSQTPVASPVAHTLEKGAHAVEARAVGERGVDDGGPGLPAPAAPISGRAEMRLVK